MANSGSPDQHEDAVPEFEVTKGADGRLLATHKGTGDQIEADSVEQLERRAMAKRIAISIRGARR